MPKSPAFIGVLARTLMLGAIFATSPLSAQEDTTSVYRVRMAIDIPITAVGYATNFIGLQLVLAKPVLTVEKVEALDPMDVNSFDRGATRQDPSFTKQANTISDWTMNTSLALPGLLMLDRKIRPHGWSLLVLYLESEAAVANLYCYTAANWVDRVRPFVYNPGEPITKKTESGTLNSFYSGHTATSACATFFMAKVYTDHHPELGGRKYMYYGLALVPPALTGYFRYKAAKHFPTDIITGGVVGALTGILIPQLHKRSKKSGASMGLAPHVGQMWGVSAYYEY